jgi:hypothetical protein
VKAPVSWHTLLRLSTSLQRCSNLARGEGSPYQIHIERAWNYARETEI